VELTWEDIIRVAKDDKYALKLTGERKSTEAPTASSSHFKPPQTGGSHGYGEKCPLCRELG
jgi:hypothetical protein